MSWSIPPAKKVVIFGRPGSGKSSLAERLGAEHGFVAIRTGELLREAVRRGDELGARVEQALKAGQCVPDPLIGALIERSLEDAGTARILFDGFPRTMGQVSILEALECSRRFRVDRYLEIAVGRDAAIAGVTGRRFCPVCGAMYHHADQLPRVADLCDHDGARLERRRDDAPGVIEVRQRLYDEHAPPILEHYRTHAPERYHAIHGEWPFDAVYDQACRALGLKT